MSGYIRIPADEWAREHYRAEWTAANPAPSWWIAADVGWSVDQRALPSARVAGATWGVTKDKAARLIRLHVEQQAGWEARADRRAATRKMLEEWASKEPKHATVARRATGMRQGRDTTPDTTATGDQPETPVSDEPPRQERDASATGMRQACDTSRASSSLLPPTFQPPAKTPQPPAAVAAPPADAGSCVALPPWVPADDKRVAPRSHTAGKAPLLVQVRDRTGEGADAMTVPPATNLSQPRPDSASVGVPPQPPLPPWVPDAKACRPHDRDAVAGMVLRCIEAITQATVNPARSGTAAGPVLALWRKLGKPPPVDLEADVALVARWARKSPDRLAARDIRAEGWDGGVDRSSVVKTLCVQESWDARLAAAKAWDAAGSPDARPAIPAVSLPRPPPAEIPHGAPQQAGEGIVAYCARQDREERRTKELQRGYA